CSIDIGKSVKRRQGSHDVPLVGQALLKLGRLRSAGYWMDLHATTPNSSESPAEVSRNDRIVRARGLFTTLVAVTRLSCMKSKYAGLLLATTMWAQPVPRMSFELASVRRNTSGPQTGFSEDVAPNGRFTGRNVALWNLIRFAYELRDLQIAGGPA